MNVSAITFVLLRSKTQDVERIARLRTRFHDSAIAERTWNTVRHTSSGTTRRPIVRLIPADGGRQHGAAASYGIAEKQEYPGSFVKASPDCNARRCKKEGRDARGSERSKVSDTSKLISPLFNLT